MIRATFTIARKELRGLFQAPTAMLFLAAFLGATLFVVFGMERFFARGLADVRPLFDGMPLLLVLLVSAITMRSWAEERRAGTLELLQTLPVSTASLVLGKYLAGLALVALALLLTTPIPVAVSFLGPLDVGPVIGGYVAALCLGSAYLALGLWVSARTDNTVVALMTTLVAGSLLYLVGSEGVLALFSADTAGLLAALGTGSRFESIERGVLDLRDLSYYLALTVGFLTLNGAGLEALRLDPGSTHGRARRASLVGTSALVIANAALLVTWLTPVQRARVDLTEHGDYTLSPVTEQILAELDEPLRVRALLSQRTHEELAPLIPTLTDLLAELELAGRGKVTVEVLDPSEDEALEAELGEQYGLRPTPFAVADRHSQAVVNAWFTVLLEVGGAHEALGFEDLIDVRVEGADVQVLLKNPEYDLARAIRRVSQDVQSTESLLARLPERATLTAYVSPGQLPEPFVAVADAMRAAGRELAGDSDGRLAFTEVDPSADPDLQVRLLEAHGVQPLATDLLAQQRFYLHLVLAAGDRSETLYPRAGLTEAEARQALEATLARVVPGQRKTVALVTATPEPTPPAYPGAPPSPTPPPDYQALRQLLGESYDVVAADLTDGHVPSDADVVLVAKAGELDERQRFALDQYLLQGGAVVALAGSHEVEARRDLTAAPEPRATAELLASWGACVGEGLAMGTRVADFPIPVEQNVGGFRLRRIELLPYPFFPDLRGADLAEHPITAGIAAMTLPWGTEVTACGEALDGRQVEELLFADVALRPDGHIQPDFRASPDGFTFPETPTRRSLALAMTGTFPSAFAGVESPVEGVSPLERSVAAGRLVVVGSSELVSDLMLQVANQSGAEVHRGNLQLVLNALDWAVQDTALLDIRSGGAFARALLPLDEDTARGVELATTGAVGAGWLGVMGLSVLLRRSRRPLPISEVP